VSSVELAGRFSLRGSVGSYRSKVKSRTLMHDRSEALIPCEIDMGKQGMTLTKTKLIHVACAIKTSHRAVRVSLGDRYLMLSLKKEAVVRAEL
jgi:hypothetical protein